MQSVSNRNFGLIVAYLIPGFVCLWGVSFVDLKVAAWLAGSNEVGPTLAGVLYVTLASLGLGMMVSAIRWIVIDQLHEVTGLKRPRWSDRDLPARMEAYTWIIENYYRYYQFYGNTLVALLIAYGLWRSSLPGSFAGAGEIELVLTAVSVVLLAGSRSALSRYYRRAGDLLAEGGPNHKEMEMTNGGGHHEEKKDKPKKAEEMKGKAGGHGEAKAAKPK